MAIAMIISGTVGWFVLATDLPALTVVFWRCAFGALAMALVCAAQGLLRRGMLARAVVLDYIRWRHIDAQLGLSV